MAGDKKKARARTGTRRFFCRRLLSEVVGALEEVRGKPQMLLENIPDLPDEEVSDMAPILSPSDNHRIDQGRLFIRSGRGAPFIEAFRFDEPQNWILGQFDGSRTLGEIGMLFHERFQVTPELAFGQVRNFFEILARYSICKPFHAHDGEE